MNTAESGTADLRRHIARVAGVMGAALLALAYVLAMHAGSAERLPAGESYVWRGVRPVHVASTDGGSCSHTLGGLTRSIPIDGHPEDLGLTLAALRTGHQFYGSSGRHSELRCDEWVTVAHGPLVWAHPIAGSGPLLAACVLLVLVGTVFGRRPRAVERPNVRRAAPLRPPMASRLASPAGPAGPAGRAGAAGPAIRSLRAVGLRPRRQVTPFLVHETALLVMCPAGCALVFVFNRIGGALGWPVEAQRVLAGLGVLGAYSLTYRWLSARWLGTPWPPRWPPSTPPERAADGTAPPPDVRPG